MKIAYRFFHGPSDWGWIQSHLPLLRIDDMCGLMAVDTETNTTVACAIFDTFLDKTCQISLIIEQSLVLRHGFMEEISQFAYDGCHRDYVFCKVAEDNIKSLRICERAGFVRTGTISGGSANGVPHIMLEMYKDDCTFYKPFKQSEVA